MASSLRRVQPAVWAVVLGLVVAACGGGAEASTDGVASLESNDTASPPSTVIAEATPEDVEQAVLAFAACMRDHGVDMDDPTLSADGTIEFGFRVGSGEPGEIDRDVVRAARDACSEHLENVTFGFRRGDDAELQDTLIEYAQCMRDNGYEMNDPDFSGFGPGSEQEEGEPRSGPFGVIEPDDPAFQAAQEACQDILGGFGPPVGPGAGRGGG
jgi:hypothetical protein